MTVDNTKRATSRATSTLSSVSDMLQSPVSMRRSTRERTTTETPAEAKASLKCNIMRHLVNDKTAIETARKKAKETYSTMTPGPQLDQKLLNAALERIEQRKSQGKHISSHYRVFANYVPPQAYGKGSKEDTDKDRLIEDCFDELCGRQRPASLEEPDDDEETPASLKKQEGEQSQELNNIPAYDPKCKARLTGNVEAAQQHTGTKGKLGKLPKSDKTRGAANSSSRDSSVVEKDSEDESSEHVSSPELASSPDPDSDSGNAEEEGKKRKAIFPMVAVRRGLALLKDTPMNANPAVTHRFSTTPACGRRAVFRGRVANKDDEDTDGEWTWVEKKGWTLGKKRACEGESEIGDCIQVASKKAKIEAASCGEETFKHSV
jgi:hypothetical protein